MDWKRHFLKAAPLMRGAGALRRGRRGRKSGAGVASQADRRNLWHRGSAQRWREGVSVSTGHPTIVGDAETITAHATEYDNLADFLHDETVACDRCGTRWYRPALAQFDADILARNGLVVCCECAAAGSGALRAAVPEAARREFVTLWARNGGVVG